MKNISISVFTPTYNRCEFLKRLYQSLKNQTCHDFEWIVVDDGSTDGSFSYLTEVENEAPFDIRLYQQKNAGKHVAINKGVSEAKGKLFFIVDSDDFLTNDAIETILKIESGLENKCEYGGVSGIVIDTEGRIVGHTFQEQYIDCTSLERDRYHIDGDKAEVYYTNVLRKYPFPHFEGENFLTESVVWYRIANAGYKIRWTNERFYICDYQNTGLSATTGKCSRNFKGYQLTTAEYLTYKQLPLRSRLMQLIAYSGTCKKENKDLHKCARAINCPYFVIKVVGYIGYIGYVLREARKNWSGRFHGQK